MAIDSRGVEYNPFLPSVGCADGAVFQVIVDGEADMEASATFAAEHDAQRLGEVVNG